MLLGGSSEMLQIWVQWSQIWVLLVAVDFNDSFNTNVWSADHIIIVIYINMVCDDSFNTKVWLFDHIIIVEYINGVCLGKRGCKIHCLPGNLYENIKSEMLRCMHFCISVKCCDSRAFPIPGKTLVPSHALGA